MCRSTGIVSALAIAGWAFCFSSGYSQATGQGGQAQPGGGAQPGVRSGTQPLNPQANMNFGINQNPWFNNPAIRQQLRMNDAQFNQFNQNYLNAWRRFNQGVTALGSDITDEMRLERMQDLRGTFNRDFSTSIDPLFTDAQQRDRYNQLYLQFQGLGAFNDPTIQRRLNLNEEQQQKLNQLWAQWNSQLGTLRRGTPTDPNSVNKQFGELRTEYEKRLNAILNQQQQKMWRDMVGESFEFPANIYLQSDGSVPAGTPAEARRPQPR